jgi:pullulanase
MSWNKVNKGVVMIRKAFFALFIPIFAVWPHTAFSFLESDSEEMGFIYSPSKTSFSVWAQDVRSMNLLLYDSPEGDKVRKFPMSKTGAGIWFVTVKEDLKNFYYLYEVGRKGKIFTTPDPCSKCLSANSKRSLIFDSKETDPKGWEKDIYPKTKESKVYCKNYTDAVIYETHLRDFSINKDSGIKNKGKYLAFTETGTKTPDGFSTGIDHLKELGITHVQLLPVYDFGSVDETKPDDYNWGYDPLFYNSPEGSYSTNPNGLERVKEFKQMVMSLHNNGIGVIMDVVYNHTFDAATSAFDILAPKYYYRMDAKGKYSSASGCGNEIATEKPLVRQFIIESLKYWMREYKIDGFRFDLMGCFDTETVKEISKELKKINPDIILYGEPWAPGSSPIPEKLRLVKGNQRGTGFAVFNDNIRNAVKGDTQGSLPGFVQGDSTNKTQVEKGIEGSINDFTDSPLESLNYVSCHDDLCLWDKLKKSSPESDVSELKKMSKLANGIVLTSQGIGFLWEGEEFARSKMGEPNTFNMGDKYNELDYTRKKEFGDLFEYYRGLVALRKAHPAFRMTSAAEIKKHLSFISAPEKVIAYSIAGNANGDEWKEIIVIYNSDKKSRRIELPDYGKWNVAVNQEAAGPDKVSKGIAELSGKFVTVPGVSMYVLYK